MIYGFIGQDGEDEAHEDEALLQARTAPDDRGPHSVIVADDMIADLIDRIPKQPHNPIDRVRHMACHELKRRRDIYPEPRDRIPVLIAYHRPFPGIVSDQKRDDKDNNIFVRLKLLF